MAHWFPKLNKQDLLDIMYSAVPQKLWPPRPTRQDADTIREVVRRASFNGYYGQQVREAVAKRLHEKKIAKAGIALRNSRTASAAELNAEDNHAGKTANNDENLGPVRKLTPEERARMERLTTEMHEECSRLLKGRKPRFPKFRSRDK